MNKLTKFALLLGLSTTTVLTPSTATFAHDAYIMKRVGFDTRVEDHYHRWVQEHLPNRPNARVDRRTRHRVQENKTTHRHSYVERSTNTHTYYHTQDRSGDALTAGVLGLAVGAIIGNSLQKSDQPKVIYQVPAQGPIIYQGTQQVTYPTVQQQQLIAWIQYCQKKYRSFNPKTGTFRGSDGLDHVCYAPVQ